MYIYICIYIYTYKSYPTLHFSSIALPDWVMFDENLAAIFNKAKLSALPACPVIEINFSNSQNPQGL